MVRGFERSGIGGGESGAGGLSGSLGGVLNGDILSSSLSPAASGAKVSLTRRSGVAGMVFCENILGLPARLIGGGIGAEVKGLSGGSFCGSIAERDDELIASLGRFRISSEGVADLLGILKFRTALDGELEREEIWFLTSSYDCREDITNVFCASKCLGGELGESTVTNGGDLGGEPRGERGGEIGPIDIGHTLEEFLGTSSEALPSILLLSGGASKLLWPEGRRGAFAVVGV